MTKILTLGPQLSEVRKSSFLVKGEEINHKMVVLERNFSLGYKFSQLLWNIRKDYSSPYKEMRTQIPYMEWIEWAVIKEMQK